MFCGSRAPAVEVEARTSFCGPQPRSRISRRFGHAGDGASRSGGLEQAKLRESRDAIIEADFLDDLSIHDLQNGRAGKAHLAAGRCGQRANQEVAERRSRVRAATFPLTDDVVAFSDEVGGGSELQIRKRRTEVGHERLDVGMATARFVKRILKKHVRRPRNFGTAPDQAASTTVGIDMNDANSIQMHNVSGRYTKPPVVTRALLDFGGMTAIYMQDAPGLRLLTEEERAESVASILAMRPYGDVWIFGYGSLIWNPAFKTVERRTARVEALHRSFCMSIIAGQASPSWPGLMLGLDKAGHCLGSAFRLDEADVAPELTLLLRREMLCRGAYIPRWLELTGEDWHSGMRSPSRSTLRVRSIAGDMPDGHGSRPACDRLRRSRLLLGLSVSDARRAAGARHPGPFIGAARNPRGSRSDG
jgi:cation transport regulator ChaC